MGITDHPASSSSGSGGFGADTFVDLANSAAASIPSVELQSTLPTNAAGAEFAKLLIALVTAGAQPNSGIGDAAAVKYSFEPLIYTVDMGTVQTSWTMNIKQNGAIVASIASNSTGQLILNATQAGGGILCQSAGTNVCFIGANLGLQMQQACLQEREATTVVAAATLVVPTQLGSGGNCVWVTGATTINLIETGAGGANYQKGMMLTIAAGAGFTLHHNNAPSGTALPIFNRLGVDLILGANVTATYRLMGTNSGTAAVGWYQI